MLAFRARGGAIPAMSVLKSGLREAMRARAIDFRPRLARAIDALARLGDADRADIFARLARRVEEWETGEASPTSAWLASRRNRTVNR
jgi:hypothetical protein